MRLLPPPQDVHTPPHTSPHARPSARAESSCAPPARVINISPTLVWLSNPPCNHRYAPRMPCASKLCSVSRRPWGDTDHLITQHTVQTSTTCSVPQCCHAKEAPMPRLHPAPQCSSSRKAFRSSATCPPVSRPYLTPSALSRGHGPCRVPSPPSSLRSSPPALMLGRCPPGCPVDCCAPAAGFWPGSRPDSAPHSPCMHMQWKKKPQPQNVT